MTALPHPEAPIAKPDGKITKEWYDFFGLVDDGETAGSAFTLVTAAYTLVNGDKGKTVGLGGSAYYVLTVGAATGFDADFTCLIVNQDTARGKRLTINGLTSFLLWPGQSVILFRTGDEWFVTPQHQRWQKSGFRVYVNSSLGNDDNDGQATGAGALATIAAAQSLVRKCIDSNGSPPEIKLDANLTYSVGSGLEFTYEGVVGASQIYLTGDTGVVISCNAGGTCINCQDRCIVTVTDVTLSTGGNSSTAVFARQLAVCDLTRVSFTGFPLGTHISVTTSAMVNILGSYSISGNAAAHLSVGYHGYINFGGFTCTVSGGLTITNFAVASTFGVITNGGVNMTFAGAGAGAGTTGTTFAVGSGGIIYHSGTLPGNVAGAAPTDLSGYGIKA